jgi:hypothetical protein
MSAGNRPRPESAARAVMLAAGEVGVTVAEYQAKRMADAAIAFYDEIVQAREVASRHLWEAPGFQEHRRQSMRHKLLDGITRRGLVPVSLPHETVHFLLSSFAGFQDPDAGTEVPESAPWDMAAVTLDVAVRRPPVDREAAVRAGILTS